MDGMNRTLMKNDWPISINARFLLSQRVTLTHTRMDIQLDWWVKNNNKRCSIKSATRKKKCRRKSTRQKKIASIRIQERYFNHQFFKLIAFNLELYRNEESNVVKMREFACYCMLARQSSTTKCGAFYYFETFLLFDAIVLFHFRRFVYGVRRSFADVRFADRWTVCKFVTHITNAKHIQIAHTGRHKTSIDVALTGWWQWGFQSVRLSR